MKEIVLVFLDSADVKEYHEYVRPVELFPALIVALAD